MSDIAAIANAGAEGAKAGRVGLNLIGRIFNPVFTRRQATADAQAKIQGALVNQLVEYIESNPLDREVLNLLTTCGGKMSSINLVNIANKVQLMLDEEAEPSLVSDDFISVWRDKARHAFDEDMQNSWARILAEEVNCPRSFSRKTVNIMADLDKTDAELFVNLSRFAWDICGDAVPLVYDLSDGLYGGLGIHFVGCSRLESLGLIQFNGAAGFQQHIKANTFISYHGQSIALDPRGAPGILNVGFVLFTQWGSELFRICDVDPVDEFYCYVRDKLDNDAEWEFFSPYTNRYI